MSARTAEDRYRWLLLAYPSGYRRARGDELLATALDAADAEGRDRPTFAEGLDLVGHGLALRVRAGRRLPASPGVRDPLAAVAVVLPMLLAARVGRGVHLVLGSLLDPAPDTSGRAAALVDVGLAHLPGALWLAVAVVLCLGLTRVAKVIAPIAAAVQLVTVVAAHRLSIRSELLWIVAGVLVAVLLLTPGLVDRGVRVLGRASLTLLTSAVAATVVVVQLVVHGRGMGDGQAVWLAALAVGVAAGRALGGHRRPVAIAVGALTGLYVLVAGSTLQWISLGYSAGLVVELVVLGCCHLLAVLVPLVAVAGRARLRRAWRVLVEPA